MNVIKKSANLIPYKRTTRRIVQCLHPYISPDFELLDALEKAVRDKDQLQIELIAEMSEVIHCLRSVQAFNAPLDLQDTYFDAVPTGITSELDMAIEASDSLNESVADGLGLRVPTDLPLETYLEIVENYRDQIVKLVESITKGVEVRDNNGLIQVQKHITSINSEIERIQKSRRYMLLEAGIDFYGRNAILVNAALVAGAFGLAGGLAGCVGGPLVSGGAGAVASGATSLAKRYNLVGGGEAATRFVDRIQADIQPFLSQLVALYVGASAPAVTVMSLRQRLSGPDVQQNQGAARRRGSPKPSAARRSKKT